MSHGCLLACQDFLQPFDMLPFTSETKLARHFHASRFSTVLSRTSYTGFYRPTVLQEIVRCSGNFPWQMTHYSPVLETGNSEAVVFISRFMHTEKDIPDCRNPNFLIHVVPPNCRMVLKFKLVGHFQAKVPARLKLATSKVSSTLLTFRRIFQSFVSLRKEVEYTSNMWTRRKKMISSHDEFLEDIR
jgi:hypothetical protein